MARERKEGRTTCRVTAHQGSFNKKKKEKPMNRFNHQMKCYNRGEPRRVLPALKKRKIENSLEEKIDRGDISPSHHIE